MNSDPDAWIRHAMTNFDVWCRASTGTTGDVGDVYFSPHPHDRNKGIYVLLTPRLVSTGRFDLLGGATTPGWANGSIFIDETTKWNPAMHTPSNKYEFAMSERLGLTFLSKRMLVLTLNAKNYNKALDNALGQALYG